MTEAPGDLRTTPLFDLHRELGGRMVPFAGYSMPVQYEGILAEHRWTRESAGLFDVSHMGQRVLAGAEHSGVAAALEALTPGAFAALGEGRMRYTLLLSETGGIIDDLMVTRPAGADGRLLLVFNAGRKEIDDAYFGEHLPAGIGLRSEEDRALLALQGPKAVDALARHCPDVAGLKFMNATETTFDGTHCLVSRSGYTGEDGFEISIPAAEAEKVARALLAEPEVKPVGLGARDSLRLEAGLPLYGHDLDETTSPVEAGLAFAVAKARRETGGFPGSDRILHELADGPRRLRVGIRPAGRAPVREGAEILGPGGTRIGEVTSGGFGPTINAPVAMGYVAAAYAAPGTAIQVSGRRGPEPAEIIALPFVPPRYVR
ncbi:glycine cleavage system aminomethyltransferase GcvT [Faunimonas sp. B44]|uniref:glycine cleavage system aminomethyltransferase GcvT n=1 Tax=Faunimonas sp. B44 TaxID=3461493 RepID=UPI004044DD29